MARYLFPNLTEKYSAVVSTHGYFEIQDRETYTSYASFVDKVKKGDKIVGPAKVIYSGTTDELGINYNGQYDDLELPCSEEEEVDYIQDRLLEYLEKRELK